MNAVAVKRVSRPEWAMPLWGACVALGLFALACALAASAVAAPLGERGYELVSYRDANGTHAIFFPAFASTGNTVNGIRPSAPDGEHFLFGSFGTVPPGTPAARASPPFIARRTTSGWHQEYVGAPGNLVDLGQLWSISQDLTKVYLSVGGSDALGGSLDPDDPGDANDAYVRNLDGSFTWLGDRPAPVDGSSLVALSSDGVHPLVRFGNSPADPLFAPVPGGQELVSVLDDGSTSDRLNLGGRALRISADGQRVAFIAARPDPAPSDEEFVFVRLRDEGSTVVVNEPEPGVVSTHVNITLLGSLSEDGSTLYFTTAQALTTDDLDAEIDLYRFHVDTSDLELVSTAAPGAPGTGQDGSCIATYGVAGCTVSPVIESPDGSTAYFLSPEELDTGATAGEPNLYASRDGLTRFVATLAVADANSTAEARYRASVVGLRPARITDDGERLVFESRAQLGTFDNVGLRQVYVYDFGSDEIGCASCPTEPALGSNADAMLTSIRGPSGNSVAPTMYEVSYLDAGRNITADAGHVFFQTQRRLVVEDINSAMDVYQYDVELGQLELISSGKAVRGALFFDNSLDGEDVFFTTQDTLVPPEQDQNGLAWKIYDARVGGGFAPDVQPAPCGEGDCRGLIPDSPGFDDIPSSTDTGRGNVVSPRVRLSVKRPSRRALARAAENGRFAIRVKRSRPGLVRVSARARLRPRGRVLRIGSASRRLPIGAVHRIAVNLTPAARRALASGRRLRVILSIRAPGARERSLQVFLDRAAQ